MLPLPFLAAPSVAATIAQSWERTLVVAHRGGAADAPENTMPAFKAGMETGAVAVECDIHLSRDGEMIILHDGTLDRTTTLKGPVKERDWSELQAAGLPRLADLTAAIKGRSIAVVELKDGDGVEAKVTGHLISQGLEDQTILFGFSAERVAKAKALAPRLFTAWLVGKATSPEAILAGVKAAKVDAFGVHFLSATPALARAAREAKVPMFVWTVPPGPQVERLKAMRVNFIITDSPRQVVAQLAGSAG